MSFESSGQDVRRLVSDALRAGLQLWSDGADGLRFRASSAGLDPAIAQRLRENRAAVIEVLEGRRLAPATPAQESVWFYSHAHPHSSAYNIAHTIEIRGALDVERLQRAADAIAARHESLRTRFAELDGVIVQVLDAEASTPVRLHRAATLDEARRLAVESASVPFVLSRDRLLRLDLFTVSSGEHLLLHVANHGIFDGLSCEIYFRELEVLYDEGDRGGADALPPPAMQYADYAMQIAPAPAAPAALEYWRAQLSGAPPVLELPGDRGIRENGVAAALHYTPLGDVRERVTALARAEGVTPFAILAGAFAVLLARYARREEVLVGTASGGRTASGTSDVIGMFANTLVLRASVAGNPSFRELVRRTAKTVSGALAHELRFEHLVADLNPVRDPLRHPIVQVTLVVNDERTEVRLGGTTGDIRYRVLPASKQFDLTVEIQSAGTSSEAVLTYRTDLFDAATAARVGEHFRNLLEGALADPDRAVLSLPMMSEPERLHVVEELNRTAVDYPSRLLHELVSEQAQRTPDAIAVKCGREALTYAQLESRANRLARRLQAHGIGPNVVAAICLDRSAGLVVAMLAVLKTGAAFLPVDRDYPADRVGYMLDTAQAASIITSADLPAVGSARRILIDDEDGAFDDAPLPVTGGPADLAYVLFTSGSTGRPKGVMVPHRAVANLVRALRDFFGTGPHDVMLQRSAISFDASIFEIFLPLTCGARLIVGSAEVQRDPVEIIDTLADEGVTMFHAVPTLLEELVREERALAAVKTLRCVCPGAEALTTRLAERLAKATGAAVVNMYGPTETCVIVALHRYDRASAEPSQPIGRPIANTRFYVVDERLEPVPPGVPGELLVGGANVGLGYINRPDLTAERFIPDPFSDDPAARLYRTGDLVRLRAGGTFEFHGRIDDQVKLGGYRIELGEIEAVIREHLPIASAVVAVRTFAAGDRRLVAYYTTHDGDAIPAGDLRRAVAGLLPKYMTPHVFVYTDALPLMPNGKVDRNALPLPDVSGGGDELEPMSEVESAVASIWREVLNVSRPGPHDNFFELGGHSLLAIRILARVRSRFGIEVPVQTVFERPTITSFAEWIRTAPAQATQIPQLEEGAL